jgi:hypothetical protein
MRKRKSPITDLYRAFLTIIDSRRIEGGLSYDDLDRAAGLSPGFSLGMLTGQGWELDRAARWPAINRVLGALFPSGYVLRVEPGSMPCSKLTTPSSTTFGSAK